MVYHSKNYTTLSSKMQKWDDLPKERMEKEVWNNSFASSRENRKRNYNAQTTMEHAL